MINVRDIADKSKKGSLQEAINYSLEVESVAVKKNTSTFNANRYKAVSEIDDYELLKDRARSIKEYSIENLPRLLETLEQVITERGGHFYIAKNADDAGNYITNVCKKHGAKLIVKGKSMTSEEIKLNDALESEGIEVAETDLAEFILQYADEQPSHIVAPAIHFTQKRISKLFKEKFNTDLPLETGEELTKFARDILRDKFLSADIGFSGVNVIDAQTGSIVLIESEGNIRMSTLAPDVHIALAGVEKVVPNRKDLATFIELIAPSGTGQPLTSYTSVIRPPLNTPSLSFDGKQANEREFHLVLLDNGRMAMRDDPVLREALYCVRCSACMNVCANFQQLGGHAFGGETYTGGIGGAWEAGTNSLEKAQFSSLCTGCSRCIPQCPVRIDIPWLNENIRERLSRKKTNERKYGFRKYILANYHVVLKWGSHFTPLSNWIANISLIKNFNELIIGISRHRNLPPFVSKSFQKNYRTSSSKISEKRNSIKTKVLFFPDIYTNYMFPDRGTALLNVLESLGADVKVGRTIPEGRAALSQGMIDTAKKQAIDTTSYFAPFIEEGWKIVIVEPSVLALFRSDYKHLIGNDSLFEMLKENSFEAVEFIEKIIYENNIPLDEIFNINEIAKTKAFYHSHCQQKTMNAAEPTVRLLQKLGVDLKLSDVECCGMAGSFGYKKEFYKVSMEVGENLFEQVKNADSSSSERILLASGVSCHDQLHEGMNRIVKHPIEFLSDHLLQKKVFMI